MLPPQSGLRQWVLTFPLPWRRRLAQDGTLLGKLTRSSEVGALLESTVRRTERHLGRRGRRRIDEDGTGPDVRADPESNLAGSAVWGQTGWSGHVSWR